MRINELVRVGERTEQRVIHHDALWDDNGNIVADAWDETVEVQVPVMGMVYREATPEEEAEYERQQAELPPPEPTPEEIAEMERQQEELPPPDPTPEERLDTLETTTDDIILMMAELIGGV